MDQKLSKLVARIAFDASTSIANLVPILKEHCSDEEYRVMARRIATASATININILDPIFEADPQLKDEFDSSIQLYGKAP